MSDTRPLSPQQLRRSCDPGGFSFETTADLPDVAGIIGQQRVVEAVRFAIGIRRYGYNLYALGPAGMGKHTFVRAFLERRAAEEPAPPDWCYVHSFKDGRRPRALRLPSERAPRLREDMERLVEELRAAIPAVFEGEDYRARRQALEARLNEASALAFAEVEKRAQEQGIALIRAAQGVGLAPLRDGQVIEPDDFKRLPEEEQTRLRAVMAELQKEIEAAAGALPKAARKHRDELRKLERRVTTQAVTQVVDDARAHWTDVPEVLGYLAEVERDVVEHAGDFLPTPEGSDAVKALLGGRGRERRPFRRYEVNVLVTRDGAGAPVVYEDHPTYANLVGRIEHISELGNLVTDFTLIQEGALHRANGGYLIVEARKLLQQPMAWDELKRSLRSQLVRVDSLARAYSLVTTASLEPEPIPLDVKVVLVGERQLYYLLSALDPEFCELFKVAADFEEQIDRTPEGEELYARLLGTFARREDLRPLDPGAVARAVEHASRRAGDSGKLQVHAESLADLLREADHIAGEAEAETVSAAHIQTAIDAWIRRASRVRERVQEDILRGTVLIDTRGETVGQVNGLSVLQLGGYAFGRPNRITARVRLGNGSVVDIEKEVALGGPLHSKGVLILAGFLGQRFASGRPLSLAASLVFEQSYSGVDGDSASCAELVALLSALADAPVRQGRAITGSVNQHGQVQPIGGVNEKIEGFFDVCQGRGLSGGEGVLIPASNVKHLMLRADVVEAAEKGLFHIWPVETVDQAVELLTGLPAGVRGDDGHFAEGSVNRRADDRLAEFAKKARAFGKTPPASGNNKNEKNEEAKPQT
ncbi:MAG: AAA family ATPase [Acidobacteria bacterium]|jgi:lon-related putative ATP-dependent protease|nr:AAA family ATPase [Acidobacteriota bacterium]